MITLEQIKAVMIGHAIGDALGVPVEFCEREELKMNPVVDMRGYGTYPVPAGSWSDDTSTFFLYRRIFRSVYIFLRLPIPRSCP